MPLIKDCLQQYRDIGRIIFNDEPTTVLNDVLHMRFLGASLKGREVEMMINNPQAATKDLNIFYKQFNSNW
jgi:hypothetical protein